LFTSQRQTSSIVAPLVSIRNGDVFEWIAHPKVKSSIDTIHMTLTACNARRSKLARKEFRWSKWVDMIYLLTFT
jgi:hypothetical protein